MLYLIEGIFSDWKAPERTRAGTKGKASRHLGLSIFTRMLICGHLGSRGLTMNVRVTQTLTQDHILCLVESRSAMLRYITP